MDQGDGESENIHLKASEQDDATVGTAIFYVHKGDYILFKLLITNVPITLMLQLELIYYCKPL